MECQDAGIIVQQRLDGKTWSQEVDKMIRWGATVLPQDRDAFVDYFATNFGPDKPPQPPQYIRPRTKTRAATKAGGPPGGEPPAAPDPAPHNGLR